MNAVALDVKSDSLLRVLAPLGLAAAAGTALVVDNAGVMSVPSGHTLEMLVEEGPRRDDLVPTKAGVAVLPRGNVDPRDALAVIEALVEGWPAVVLTGPHSLASATTQVWPLLPHPYDPPAGAEGVFQATGLASGAGHGLTLPVPSRACVAALLAGRLPCRSRWINAWRTVWGRTWH